MTLAALFLAAVVLPAPQEGAARAEQAVQAAGSPESHIEAGLKEFKRRRFTRAQEHFEQAGFGRGLEQVLESTLDRGPNLCPARHPHEMRPRVCHRR